MSRERPELLMICAGNICRSPMAEYLARDYAKKRGRELDVRSASLLGLDGQPAHRYSIWAMKELNIDLTPHRAQPVSEALVRQADYILVMELAQAADLRTRYPEVGDKILTLGTFGGLMDIPDPLGSLWWTYRKRRDEIRRCVEAFIDQMPPPK